jgi:hypothetical protein
MSTWWRPSGTGPPDLVDRLLMRALAGTGEPNPVSGASTTASEPAADRASGVRD